MLFQIVNEQSPVLAVGPFAELVIVDLTISRRVVLFLVEFLSDNELQVPHVPFKRGFSSA